MVSDILQIEGINSKGFGTIPKLVMQDRRLTIQAKAIYAYFCSYAGAGKIAFPSRSKILYDLGISQMTYYKHLNLLKEHGYIKCWQERIDGIFTRNVYTLPCEVPIPCAKSSCTVKSSTKKSCTRNYDTNINNIKNNNIYNNQSVCQKDGQVDIDSMTERIKENISYDSLITSNNEDIAFVDECISIILDAVYSLSPTITIDNEQKPKEIVVYMLMKLDYWDMIAIIRSYKAITDTIRRKRQYILSMLYNIKLERNSGLINELPEQYR